MRIIERIWNGILLAGLFFMPFVYGFGFDVGFEVPRVYFVLAWVEMLILISIFLIKRKQKLNKSMVWLFGLVFGVMLISSLFGSDLFRSVVGNYYRFDGLFTYLHLWLLAIMVGWYLKKSDTGLFLRVLGMSGIMLSVWAILQKLLGWPMWGTSIWEEGIGLSFGNPNYLAGWLIVSLPSTVIFLKKFGEKRWKYAEYLLVTLHLVGMYLTGSRAVIIAAGLFWVSRWGLSVSKKTTQYVVVGGLLVLTIFAFWWVKNDSTDPALVFAPQSRERIVRKMILGFTKKPWLGYGWSNADKAFGVVDWPYRVREDIYVDKAHSQFLEYLVTTGILGLIVYVVFLLRLVMLLWGSYKASKNGDKKIYETVLLTAFMYIVHSQMNVVSVGEEVVFMIVVGLALKDF